MARGKVELGNLLDQRINDTKNTPATGLTPGEPPVSTGTEPNGTTTPATAPKRASKAATTPPPHPATPTGARWQDFDRKEARVRPEQYEDLTMLARRLKRARNHTGERITENTLIRVAIDVLLERQGELTGTSEAELLASARSLFNLSD